MVVEIDCKDPDEIRKGEAHILQGGDAARYRELILSVIPIIREAVDPGWLQTADLILVAEHSEADSGQF